MNQNTAQAQPSRTYKSKITLQRQSLNTQKQGTKHQTHAHIHFWTNGTQSCRRSQSSHHMRSVSFYHTIVHDNDSVNEMPKVLQSHHCARPHPPGATALRSSGTMSLSCASTLAFSKISWLMGHNFKSIDSLGCRQTFVETSGLSKKTAGRQKSYNLRVVDNGFRRTCRSDQGRAELQNLPCRLAMSAPAGKWRLRPSTASSYRPVPAALRLQANGAAPLKRLHGWSLL